MRAKKIDINQPQIVAGLRKIGWSVLVLSEVGKGCPDLFVSSKSKKISRLMEIKSEKGTYTPVQEEFHAKWRGEEILTVRSLDEAIQQLTELQWLG